MSPEWFSAIVSAGGLILSLASFAIGALEKRQSRKANPTTTKADDEPPAEAA